MSPNATRLRELGYSVDADGNIECHREQASMGSRLDTRYQHERTGVIRIDLARDSDRAGRDLVERLIAVVDEPKALIGRTRTGSAVMFFRVSDETVEPTGSYGDQSTFEPVAADGTRFRNVCTSHATLNPVEYTWAKGLSQLDVQRDAFAILFADIGAAVIDAAFQAGAKWASQYDAEQKRQREFEKRRPEIEARTPAGYYTPEAIQAREDEDLVASTDPGTNWLTAGAWGDLVDKARRRIKLRKQAAAEAAQG